MRSRYTEQLSERYAREVRPLLTAALVFDGIAWKTQRDDEWRGPCPLHGGDGPNFAVKPATLEWYCHSGCGKKGGRETQYVMARYGLRDYTEAVRFLAKRAGIDLGKPSARSAAPPRRPVTPPRPPAPKTYKRPPAAEVAELWNAAGPIAQDEAASAYLRSRALDPAKVDLLVLARVLPPGITLPTWAWHWSGSGTRDHEDRQLRARGYRLVFPVFGHTGAMENMRARPLYRTDGKKAFPGEGDQGGLVLANGVGVGILEGDPIVGDVWIAEGEPDFLTVATRWPPAMEPAVFGVGSGWWTPELAARIPDGSRVIVATDKDVEGERYAQDIVRTLAARARAGRLTLRRW